MLGAVMILTSCDRNRHTPDPGAQGVPISFSALSHEAPVKADDLSEYHEDFGVWGIARYKDDTKPPYIPWLINKEDQMAKVSSQGVPETGAYWFSGYKYNFIALAPYATGATDLAFITEESANANDAMSFTFSMADKYTASDFDFDLMGAVGEQTVADAKNAVPQELIFSHLLAKICINVTFAGLPQGTTGSVTELRLDKVVTKCEYSITDNDKGDLIVTYEASTDNLDKKCITLTGNDMLTGNNIVHIIPQIIEDFELELDFRIGEVQTNNYKLNLKAAKYDKDGNAVEYRYNQWYNWNITITPKGIAFDVSVKSWKDVGPDNANDFEFDFE